MKMRNTPLKAFAGDSPLKHGDHDPEKMTDAHKRQHGQEVPKTMTQKDFDEGRVEGFMHPPYKKPRDLAGNVRYHHGYRWKKDQNTNKK